MLFIFNLKAEKKGAGCLGGRTICTMWGQSQKASMHTRKRAFPRTTLASNDHAGHQLIRTLSALRAVRSKYLFNKQGCGLPTEVTHTLADKRDGVFVLVFLVSHFLLYRCCNHGIHKSEILFKLWLIFSIKRNWESYNIRVHRIPITVSLMNWFWGI